jgi:hypothetical protein
VNIIVYRDGVSSGQHEAVKLNEISVLLTSFEAAKNKSPLKDTESNVKYSYIIVNKRINAK